MDAWLDKVKFFYETLSATVIEQNDKLEAIKKIVLDEGNYLPHWKIKDIKEILEVIK